MSVLLAALSPVISKRIVSSVVGGEKELSISCDELFPEAEGHCAICYKSPKECLFCSRICASGYLKDTGECVCKTCKSVYHDEHCSRCDENSCLACDDGYYLDDKNKCIPCPAGSYCHQVLGNSVIKQCQKGYAAPNEGMSACLPCEKSSNTTAGSVAVNEGSEACVTCLDGNYASSSAQSTACESCPKGYYCPGGLLIPCAKGYSNNSEGQTSCVACKKSDETTTGTVAVSESSQTCSKCIDGTYAASDAQGIACGSCPAGYYCPDGKIIKCPAGKYSTGGAKECTLCPAGSYSAAGASSCSTCAAGSYSAAGASSCSACASGTTSASGAASCSACSSFFSNCTSCTATACTACKSGYKLVNGRCEIDNPCPANTIYVNADGKDLCVTQYNMGDKTEFPVNVSGVSVVSTRTDCSANACCWQGQTAACDSINGGYSGCNRTVCTHYAAEIICNSLNYYGLSWRLPTKDELAGFSPTTYSINIGTSGLMLCDYLSGYGSVQCLTYLGCNGSYNGGCFPYIVWSSTLYSSSGAYRYELNSGSWSQYYNDRRFPFSVRCVSPIGEKTCKDTFGNGCVECSSSACTRCMDGYTLKNGKCVVAPTCPANTIYVNANGKDLCVTQYNMGDKTEFPVNVSGVTVVSTNTECSANACCWQGKTAESCNSENGGYSGCNRTQCTHYAAEIICNNLNYGGMSWRLPTRDELSGFYPTYSKDKGASGLMLCNYNSGYGSPQCGKYNVCDGSFNGNCYPSYVWSSALSSSSYAYYYRLDSGSWLWSSCNRRRVLSVRCVSPLGENTCKDTFGNGCVECSSSACTRCMDGYTLKNGKCVVVPTCPANTVKITVSGKDLCVTQYNMGDKPEFPVNVSGVKVVSTNSYCSANACCWQGKTADPCDSDNGGYSGCNRTQCTQYAAEIICNNLNYGGMSWRLPTKDELKGFYPTYSKNVGTSGLMLCDHSSGYGSAQCSNYDVCYGSRDGYCRPYYVWSSTLDGSSSAIEYSLGSGSWYSDSYIRRVADSVRCVSEL